MAEAGIPDPLPPLEFGANPRRWRKLSVAYDIDLVYIDGTRVGDGPRLFLDNGNHAKAGRRQTVAGRTGSLLCHKWVAGPAHEIGNRAHPLTNNRKGWRISDWRSRARVSSGELLTATNGWRVRCTKLEIAQGVDQQPEGMADWMRGRGFLGN